MSYFQHSSISNSDLRTFLIKMGLAREMPANLQAIYEFGSTFHATILEPHLVNKTILNDQVVLAQKMRNTFFKNELCRSFVMAPDFQRELEYYGPAVVGEYRYQARCKADGYRKSINTILEIKGLNVTTKQAFEDALVSLDYDRAAAHYMITMNADRMLIAGMSKKKPERMFTRIVKKHDEWFLQGEEKLRQALKLLRDWSPEDVELIKAA